MLLGWQGWDAPNRSAENRTIRVTFRLHNSVPPVDRLERTAKPLATMTL
jgi:hypothetical protein